MTIRDSVHREFEAKLKIWKDGKIWVIAEWHFLCKWNIVEKKILEFMNLCEKRTTITFAYKLTLSMNEKVLISTRNNLFLYIDVMVLCVFMCRKILQTISIVVY